MFKRESQLELLLLRESISIPPLVTADGTALPSVLVLHK
jgi:hypothetical protein